jgi:pimeloyl-ACP methyl ester carboxylesterase
VDVDIEIPGPGGRPIGVIDWGGGGDPLLLVHGGGTNAAEWTPVAPLLGDYRCLAFDLPGHGRTPAPADLSYELWIQCIDAVIEHFALPRRRLVLVGGSFGGALSVWYAVMRPGLRAVIGVDSARNATPRPQREPRTAAEWRSDGQGWVGDQQGYEARVAKWVADGIPEECARRAHVRHADGRVEQAPTAEFLSALDAIGTRAENPLTDPAIFGRLDCPALLLCANEGTAADIRDYVDSMPQRFPMVSVTWIDGPHALDWHAPDLVAEQVRGFLAGQA